MPFIAQLIWDWFVPVGTGSPQLLDQQFRVKHVVRQNTERIENGHGETQDFSLGGSPFAIKDIGRYLIKFRTKKKRISGRVPVHTKYFFRFSVWLHAYFVVGCRCSAKVLQKFLVTGNEIPELESTLLMDPNDVVGDLDGFVDGSEAGHIVVNIMAIFYCVYCVWMVASLFVGILSLPP